MSYEFYRILHFVGIFMLFYSLGALFLADKKIKGAVIGHGVGLLIILVAGFGMQAKMREVYDAAYGTTFPTWMILKLVIWLLFGAMIVVAKRKLLPCFVAWILVIGLGATSAWIGFNKPALNNKPAAAEKK